MGITKEPILSVTLMTPGKKKTLHMCLESIQQLKTMLPCELIVVDTGCDTEERKLLEAYADEVVSFTWINDFAAGRNAGLERCCGEWVLYIDDDEVIKNPSPLVDFFVSGAYERYQWAELLLWNYSDWDEETHDEGYILRLVHRSPGLHFVGKIHETLVGPPGEYCQIDAVLGHYGYIYASAQEKLAHANRNIKLLEDALKRNEDDAHAAMQLAQEYHVVEWREQQEQLCHLFYSKADDLATIFRESWRDIFACGWVDALYAECRYDDALVALKEIEKDTKILPYTRGALALYHCLIMSRMNLYENAVEEGQRYMQCYAEHRDVVNRISCLWFISTAYEETVFEESLQTILLSALFAGNGEMILKLADQICWESKEIRVREEIPDAILHAIQHTDANKEALYLCERMMRNRSVVDYLLEEWGEENGFLAELNVSHPMILSARVRAIVSDYSADKAKQLLKEMASSWDSGTCSQILATAIDVIVCLKEANVSIVELASRSDVAKAVFEISRASNSWSVNEWMNRMDLLGDIPLNASPAIAYLWMEYGLQLLQQEGISTFEDLYMLMKQIGAASTQYYSWVYTTRAMEDGQMLSPKALFCLGMQKFVDSFEQNKLMEAVDALKDNMGMEMQYDIIISKIVHSLSDYLYQ